MSDTKSETNLSAYDLLGIPFVASDEDIRLAYRRMVKRYHPDVAGESGREMFEDIQQAYEVLSDPKTKKRYDALRKLQEAPIVDFDQEPLPPIWQSGSFSSSASIHIGGITGVWINGQKVPVQSVGSATFFSSAS